MTPKEKIQLLKRFQFPLSCDLGASADSLNRSFYESKEKLYKLLSNTTINMNFNESFDCRYGIALYKPSKNQPEEFGCFFYPDVADIPEEDFETVVVFEWNNLMTISETPYKTDFIKEALNSITLESIVGEIINLEIEEDEDEED